MASSTVSTANSGIQSMLRTRETSTIRSFPIRSLHSATGFRPSLLPTAVRPANTNYRVMSGIRQMSTKLGAAAGTESAVKQAPTSVKFVAEYDSTVLLYRHAKTGAQVMSLVNGDENKTFGVVLRTPVEDSTGIPHILEHSVLCGSRKYPIKEPFVELMKGSLNTFLNAFTYPDRTCYPVASCNLQDFYNLVDVYLDAVFHPKCVEDERTFQQEGWHYELDDPKDELVYKGVVFNEMKGVYSQPDSVMNRVIQEAVFPSNTYRVDSGGDPAVIPDLTFEKFQDFHRRYYHPSNARFWFYGDDDPVERLRILDRYLSEFEPLPVDSTVDAQPLMKEPVKVTKYYAAGEGGEDSETSKAFVALNWLLSEDQLDLETELAFGFLNYLMLGTSASPLRKALMDSGLGEALIGGGLEDELRQPMFSIGLKGVEPENMEKVCALVRNTLAELAETGFTDTAIEAAINTIEFSLRENNTGRFPRGLSLMLRAMSSWLYDRDPFQPLQWTTDLERFKARLSSGEDVFGPLIKNYLLDNKHCVTVELLPDTELGAKGEAAERDRLSAHKASLSEEQLKEIIENTRALRERQETPDEPEALKCVPTLNISDIPKEITVTPTAQSSELGATLLRHELFTNDILYLEAGLDLRPVPASLLPLVPLFCRCLTQMGTETESFVELTERIGRKTGGLSIYPFTSTVKGEKEPVAMLMLRGKAMADKSADLLEVMRDCLLTARLDDRARFKQMVLETRSSLEAGLVGSGHSFAASRLDAQRSIAGWVSEQMGGYSYLEYIRKLVARVESEWDGVVTDLEAIRSAVLSRSKAYVNMTADGSALDRAAPAVTSFLESLPDKRLEPADWDATLPLVNEAICVPTQVNYVGKAANLYEDAGYELSGSSYVINKLLGTTWIWDRIRVSGGAYGGFTDFDSHSGMFTYLSYRDPNLLKSVEVYDGTPGFLRELDLDQDALAKAIIGTIGDIDSYQLPDAKGYTEFMRHLLKVTPEDRQKRRDEILGTTVKDFREFADALEAVRGDKARVVAVTSLGDANEANAAIPDFFTIKKAL
uniref:Presequence protease 2 n=1 Tax=Tetraselmis sp. GSL018 TaxID=582737 RepID=A0A061S1H5_9CHLO|eukprot:CAMPEP_0177604360 /NCGR_PEP_ID=MMETSP0419_2-20121207/16072_1 /TAXON_ID=582737 /ORGANISM="Tetraselmis sp., Strain GSL018" /LENGTH=1052 /DNA_ID=CAMNT_0019098329 /DNA_START=141 /DNA_END=3299 /DNA_ORIENTATION=-